MRETLVRRLAASIRAQSATFSSNTTVTFFTPTRIWWYTILVSRAHLKGAIINGTRAGPQLAKPGKIEQAEFEKGLKNC